LIDFKEAKTKLSNISYQTGLIEEKPGVVENQK